MNTSENIVELDDVRVYFPVRRFLSVAGYVRAVDGVSVVINRGETLALVGESGSGKTTLGKSTIGLVKPTSGKVLFDGVNIAELDEKQLKKLRRKAGVIFQDP